MIKTNHIVSHLPPTAFIFLRTETIVFSQEKSYGTLFLLIVLGQSPWKFVTVGNFPGFQPFSLLIVFLFFFIHPLSLCARYFQPSLFLFVSFQEIVPLILSNCSDKGRRQNEIHTLLLCKFPHSVTSSKKALAALSSKWF